MITEDFALFSAKLIELGELYDVTLTESKLLLYFEALSEADLDFVLGAILQAARTCKFFPKPAELITLIRGDDEDHAERAWVEYKAAARTIGGYGSPTFSDPSVAQTLLQVFGSWEAACWTDFTPEMWSSKRKEFGRVYRIIAQRAQPMHQLPGFVERENALHGYTEPAKRLNGDDFERLGDGEAER